MIPTAESILDILIPFKDNVSKEENEDSLRQNKETLIAWVKLWCTEQAKVISENAEIKDIGDVGEDGWREWMVIDKESILKAFSLDNIK